MAPENIYRLLTFTLVAAAMTISGYYRRKADREAGALDESEGQKLLILLRAYGLVVILPLIGYWINPHWVTWARVGLPDWIRWLAALLAASMIPVIFWIFRSIGENISPTQATRAGHTLVTTGPYRYVRHPLYSGGFVFFAAISILSGLWWLFAGLAIGMLPLLYRTPKEEARLLAAFGTEYADYMAQTGRFIPKLRRSSPLS